MRERIVDTSPLIFLAYLDRLELLKIGVENVFAPRAVIEEVFVKEDEATARIKEALSQWLKECWIARPELLVFLRGLGKGEAEVLAQAVERGITSVVLDDLDARRRAITLGLKPIGTVGLLLAAKRKGLIRSLKEELDKLVSKGFRISDQLWERALREAGEL